jgi:hypothetical protein
MYIHTDTYTHIHTYTHKQTNTHTQIHIGNLDSELQDMRYNAHDHVHALMPRRRRRRRRMRTTRRRTARLMNRHAIMRSCVHAVSLIMHI